MTAPNAPGAPTSTDPAKSLFEKLLGWLPAWLGYVLIMAAGVVAIVIGIMQSSPGLVAFGVAAILAAALAWWQGGKGEPKGDPSSFGGAVSGLDGWVWLVILGLFVVALIIAFVT